MTAASPDRVLIVDDDPGIRRMLAASLKNEGYRTSDASDGEEALEIMRAGETDLVLLDLMMPRVTGWDVLAERATEPALRRIPIIVITAERGDGVARIHCDALCVVLPKPFDLSTLRALIRSSLRAASIPPPQLN